jgi:hypothetical protein
MNFFSYIVARDYGFAPNPFWGICTLATCKPGIRKSAQIGDWIFGTGSKGNSVSGKLIYAMEVSEKLSFDQYWGDERFQIKKPVMNGSFKEMYGDNIYHTAGDGSWLQEDSHHALPDGSINTINLRTDTKGVYVLIATNFYYFGRNCIDIPQNLVNEICMDRQGYKYVSDASGNALVQHLQNFKPKKTGQPIQFDGSFKRFGG